jgi:hypothetical protein
MCISFDRPTAAVFHLMRARCRSRSRLVAVGRGGRIRGGDRNNRPRNAGMAELGNRPRVTRLDRAHRPAPRRDPELLPVSRAAEFLTRSARRTPVKVRSHHRQRALRARLRGGVDLITAADIGHSKEFSRVSAILCIITGYKRFPLPAIFNPAVASERAR